MRRSIDLLAVLLKCNVIFMEVVLLLIDLDKTHWLYDHVCTIESFTVVGSLLEASSLQIFSICQKRLLIRASAW